MSVEVFIPLTQGKVTVIDFDDFESVRGSKWFAHLNRKNWYARRTLPAVNGKQKTLFLHRFLMPGVDEIDHINGDGLDNRRENLRAVTTSQNSANRRKHAGCTSNYKGICWHKDNSRWTAQICVGGQIIYLGSYDLDTDAARAYDAAAKQYFGEFARLNFPSQERTG